MATCCAPGRPEPVPGALPVTSGAGIAQESLLRIPGGVFLMGYDGPLANPGDREGPVREVAVSPYRISATTVTNAAFGAFVAATGYATEAESEGWSFVFDALVSEPAAVTGRVSGASWWCAVEGASWRTPGGPGSHAPEDHPVVHVSARDAEAYCTWTGTRLPTEAEWEHAARGGLEGAVYPWGDEPAQGRCVIWEGDFPTHHTGTVGPVAAATLEPNGFGLFHAVGNVWEWTADAWEPGSERRARRGGSYLCHSSYCNRYRVAARDHSHPGDSTGNIGFRVAQD